jgi:dienelactone hydrolase
MWIRPRGAAVGRVIALGDAGQTPEQPCGLEPGLAPEDQFARRLAENGFDVLIPALVDRGNQWSGHPEVGMMPDQTHREWIYRQAFHLGRHVIGYEIQSVLAALGWFGEGAGVAGYGEGGLIALYAAAADPRIRRPWSRLAIQGDLARAHLPQPVEPGARVGRRRCGL